MAETPEGEILELLLTHAQAFADAEGLPIALPNIKEHGLAHPYLSVAHIPVTREAISLGNTRPITDLLQVTVVDERHVGIVQMTEIAGKLSQHFAQGTRLDGPTVCTVVTNQPRRASHLFEDNEVRLPISFQFTTYLLKGA